MKLNQDISKLVLIQVLWPVFELSHYSNMYYDSFVACCIVYVQYIPIRGLVKYIFMCWIIMNKCKNANINCNCVFLRHLSFLMSYLFNSLFQSDSLRLFMQESPAFLQTSFQFEGWRGIKREEGRGRRGEHRRTMHFRKP